MLTLPERPNLDQIRTQAKDLVKSRRVTDPAFRLAQAQRQIALDYGFPSWPRLVAHIGFVTHRPLIHAAIRAGDLDEVLRLARSHPELFANTRWKGVEGHPFALAAQRGKLDIVQALRGFGDPDLQHALSRAAMNAHGEVMDYLIAEGADVNGPYRRDYWHYGPPLMAVCEVQNAVGMELLIERGARMQWTTSDGIMRDPRAMLVSTYHRDPASKHACLEVCARHGLEFPDTPTMALHRGRLDLIGIGAEDWNRRYSLDEIFPASIGIEPESVVCGAPIAGTTLLHQTVEWDDHAAVEWLLARGADPNVRAQAGADGFSDQTPVFHTAITFGRKSAEMAEILIRAGADRGLRANVRVSGMEHEPTEIALRGVTASEFGSADWPSWLQNPAAVEYLR